MYRATTPTHVFTLPFDTSTCTQIQVTYSQNDKTVLVKHYKDNTLPDGMTLDEEDVNIFLSQEETLLFGEGRAQAQIRVMTGGKVIASQKMNVPVHGVLNEEVI